MIQFFYLLFVVNIYLEVNHLFKKIGEKVMIVYYLDTNSDSADKFDLLCHKNSVKSLLYFMGITTIQDEDLLIVGPHNNHKELLQNIYKYEIVDNTNFLSNPKIAGLCYLGEIEKWIYLSSISDNQLLCRKILSKLRMTIS